MSVLTVIGSGWGGLMVLPLFASPRTRAFAASLSAVLATTGIVVFVLKAIVQRKRPYLVVPGVHPRIFEAPTDFSFPSGHAAGSFAFAMFVAVVLVRHAIYEPNPEEAPHRALRARDGRRARHRHVSLRPRRSLSDRRRRGCASRLCFRCRGGSLAPEAGGGARDPLELTAICSS